MTRHFNWRYASMFAAAVFAFDATRKADAASFQLRENTTLGAARAGSGATGGDLSTMYNNPAIMATLDKSTVAALATVVAPSFRFKSDGATQTQAAGIAPGTTILDNFGNGGNAGSVTVIPAGYLMWNVNDHLNLGLGVTVPFGLTTKYDPKWIGRYFAIKSQLRTTDINPAFSYKVNKYFSFGGGISVQFAKAELSRAVWNVVNGRNPNPNTDTLSSFEATSLGYGFNAGILVSPWEHTRFGLSYRSSVQHVFKGNAIQTGGSAPGGFLNNLNFVRPIKANLALPEIVVFSAHHDINNRWAIMADVEWTRWSRFKDLRVYNEGSAVNIGGGNFANGSQLTSETFDYKNTWFYSIGTRWQYRDNLAFKFGLAYDQTPSRDNHRSPRVPDASRIWVTTGLEHDFNSNTKLTVDYAYIHFQGSGIRLARETPAAGLTETLNGKFESNSHLLGVKLQYKF